MARYLKLSLDDYHACLQAVATAGAASLDDPRARNAVDERVAAPDVSADQADAMKRLKSALAALPERLRRVLELYYGEDLTLREIGNVLGVSESRISQLMSTAVAALRDGMR